MKFKNKNAGMNWFKNQLESQGYQIINTQFYNHDRHELITVKKDDKTERFYCLFKRDFFFTFHKQFPKWSKDNPTGYGESINKKYLDIAISHDAVLVFMYEDGKIYKIYPMIIKNICGKNKLIRSQDKTNSYNKLDYSGTSKFINEVTYSFPICLLKRFGDEE